MYGLVGFTSKSPVVLVIHMQPGVKHCNVFSCIAILINHSKSQDLEDLNGSASAILARSLQGRLRQLTNKLFILMITF